MIDLHCHLLPGVDDGAAELSVALEMARAAVADGVEIVACTPHMLPGVYYNDGPSIREATQRLQAVLAHEGIPLRLVTGCDAHMAPKLVTQLRSGEVLSLADSRYVLVEPPHHIAPVRLEDFFFGLVASGYVPVLTHPERLTWIKSKYDMIERLYQGGVWMQLTAGSLLGMFGRRPLYWAERMLDEGMVHILASDAHDALRRVPNLGTAREVAAKRLGGAEAENLVLTRPRGILADEPPLSLPKTLKAIASSEGTKDDFKVKQRTSQRPVAQAPGRNGGSAGRGIASRLRQFFGS